MGAKGSCQRLWVRAVGRVHGGLASVNPGHRQAAPDSLWLSATFSLAKGLCFLWSKFQRCQCGHLIRQRALFTRTFQEQPGLYWTMWSVRLCSPTAGTTFPRTLFSVLPGLCGGQLKWFCTTPTTDTMEPSNSIPEHAPRKTENRDSDICMPILSHIIHSIQMVETTHMSIEWIHKMWSIHRIKWHQPRKWNTDKD